VKAPKWHEALRRRWVCEVVRSGYHNGAGCSPTDAHEGWDCGWRLELSLPDTPASRRLLRVHGDEVL
jgi:hypothetical protein